MNFQNPYLITEVHLVLQQSCARRIALQSKNQRIFPEIASTKVIDKHKLAHDNILAQKDSNKKYHDTCQKVKESDINVGDDVICNQRKTNKVIPLFNPDKLIVYKRR